MILLDQESYVWGMQVLTGDIYGLGGIVLLFATESLL